MVPIRKDDLLMEDRQKALRYLMFIKEKQMGQLKRGDERMAECKGDTLTRGMCG